jgi:hypothetical protein
MLNDTHRKLFIKKRTIVELNAKNIELESKVKEDDKTIIKKLKSINIYETYLSEIGMLKVKI